MSTRRAPNKSLSVETKKIETNKDKRNNLNSTIVEMVSLAETVQDAAQAAGDVNPAVTVPPPQSRQSLTKTVQDAAQAARAVKGKSKKLFVSIAKYETGESRGVSKIVKDYLAGETGFEMNPDDRWEDYNYYGTDSVPPVYSKKTATICAALPFYPLCCLPCCCRSRKGLCPQQYEMLKTKNDRQSKILGSFGCMGCHCFDFLFETNRSKILSLWNLVVCFVVLLSTLNPLGSEYESQAGCRPSFSFRPGLLKSLYYPS